MSTSLAATQISIWDILKKKFPENEYVILKEVRDNAGFHATNAADGIVMNLWPSRGLELYGLEIKSYRSDWLREFKNPKKAEAIFKYCDRFYLVTTDDKVIFSKEEIPKTWGWMCVKKGKLCTEIEALKLQPEAISRGFLASLLKRATKGLIDPKSVQPLIDSKVEIQTNYLKLSLEATRKEFTAYEAMVKKFEQESGVQVTAGWRGEKIAPAVKFIINGGMQTLEAQLRNMEKTANDIASNITQIIQHSMALKIDQEITGVPQILHS